MCVCPLSTLIDIICKIKTKCPYFIFPFANEQHSDGECVSVHSIELLTAIGVVAAAAVDVNVIFSLFAMALYLRLTILSRHIFSSFLALVSACACAHTHKSTSIIYRSLHLCIFYSLFSFSDSFYGNVFVNVSSLDILYIR